MIHLLHVLSTLPDPPKGSVPLVTEFQSQTTDGGVVAVTNSKEVVWFKPEYPNVRSVFRAVRCLDLYSEIIDSMILNFPESIQPMTLDAIKASVIKVDPLSSRVVVRPKFRKKSVIGGAEGLNLTSCAWMSQIKSRNDVAIVIPGESHMADIGLVKIIGRYSTFVAYGCFTKMVVHAS